MLVKLRNAWFVDGRRFRRPAGGGAIEIPDKYKDVLPKSAKVVDEVIPDNIDDEKLYVNPAHAQDWARAAAEAESIANEKARWELEEQKKKLAEEKAAWDAKVAQDEKDRAEKEAENARIAQEEKEKKEAAEKARKAFGSLSSDEQ